ncbi:MAG: hypothetical protein AAGA85_26200 [Bacteroidota bacterium]
MRALALSFFLFFSLGSTLSYCQYYEVIKARKSYRDNGERIKKYERVDRKDIVTVKQNGELLLKSVTYVNPHLKPGRYNIDSLMTLDYRRHEVHDSLKHVLRSKHLLGCKFRYKVMMVPGSNRHYEADRIKVFNKPMLTIKERSNEPSKVRWSNPDARYERSHLVVVQDAESKSFIDVFETNNREIHIDFASYNYPLMQYFVKALDCRGSLTYGVKVVP